MSAAVQTYTCRGIVPGRARGTVLRSADGICFYRVDPESAVVVEKDHALCGVSIAGAVLVFPTGKGSSVVQLDGLYQLVKHGVAPTAMVVESPDTVLVTCAVIMDIPMVTGVDPAFDEGVPDGCDLDVNADAGRLVVLQGDAAELTISRGSETDEGH